MVIKKYSYMLSVARLKYIGNHYIILKRSMDLIYFENDVRNYDRSIHYDV